VEEKEEEHGVGSEKPWLAEGRGLDRDRGGRGRNSIEATGGGVVGVDRGCCGSHAGKARSPAWLPSPGG
jgi:hypothetical protein